MNTPFLLSSQLENTRRAFEDFFLGKKVSENIYLRTTHSTPSYFIDQVIQAIKTLSSQEVGERLLKKIGLGRHWVVIEYAAGKNYTKSLDKQAAQIRGEGSPSIIRISEGKHVLGFRAEIIENPFYIVLAHELIHAYHISNGKLDRKATYGDPIIWSENAEVDAILGRPTLKTLRVKLQICENAIRLEHGLSLRFSHHGYLTSLLFAPLKDRIRKAGETHLLTWVIYRYIINKVTCLCLQNIYNANRTLQPDFDEVD